MNSTTYLSQAAREQLAAAQAALDTHVLSSADGRCTLCLVVGPCAAQSAAAVTFARYQMLPRRRPGATRPELIGARCVSFHRALTSCSDRRLGDLTEKGGWASVAVYMGELVD